MISQTQNWPKGFNTRLIPVIQGEFQVSSDSEVAFSTVLGSCVAVCLFDPKVGIGGMNHYLLAESASNEGMNLKYGVHAMELLVNQLFKQGASRKQLCAKIFGGSRMTGRFANIGPRNAEFAVQFLANEGFDVVAQDLGGTAARRVNFHPTTGIARVIHTETVAEFPKVDVQLPPSDNTKQQRVVLF